MSIRFHNLNENERQREDNNDAHQKQNGGGNEGSIFPVLWHTRTTVCRSKPEPCLPKLSRLRPPFVFFFFFSRPCVRARGWLAQFPRSYPDVSFALPPERGRSERLLPPCQQTTLRSTRAGANVDGEGVCPNIKPLGRRKTCEAVTGGRAHTHTRCCTHAFRRDSTAPTL